jgi:hypothetical protein
MTSGSASRIPTAPGSASRIPTAPGSNPAPARPSAVMKAVTPAPRTTTADRLPIVPAAEAKATAEREFQAALLQLKAFRYADASPGFARAAELVPQHAEYRLYARWSTVMQKGGPLNVHDRGDLWRIALGVIGVDPNSAFGHYVAGAIAQEDGQKAIAVRYLSRAVKLDTQLVDAQRRLRIAERAD